MALRVSLRDVAATAQVAVSTASLALRDDQRVQPATRQRVQAIARELGYFRNPHLTHLGRRRLQMQKDARIPILFLQYRHSHLPSHWFTLLQKAGEPYGYHFERFYLEEMENLESFGKQIFTRGFQGVLLYALDNVDFLQYLPIERLTLVGIDMFDDEIPIEVVRHDYFTAGLKLYQKLHQRGFHRIGSLLGIHSPLNRDDHMRLGGAYAGVMSLPESERLPLWNLDLHPQTGDTHTELVRNYLQRFQPDALVTTLSGLLTRLEYMLPELKQLPRAAIYTTALDATHPYAGFTFDEELMAETTLTILDRLVRLQAHGYARCQIHHEIAPAWNEGITLTPSPP